MTITLTSSEIQAITGYVRPTQQLRTLHSRGFWRACWRCNRSASSRGW